MHNCDYDLVGDESKERKLVYSFSMESKAAIAFNQKQAADFLCFAMVRTGVEFASRMLILVQLSDYNARLLSVSFLYPRCPVDIKARRNSGLNSLWNVCFCRIVHTKGRSLQPLMHMPTTFVRGQGCPDAKS